MLAAHGCWICPRTGLRAAPSASMLDRLGKLLDPDELEAAVSAAVAVIALDPAVPAAYAAHRAEQQREQEEKRKKRQRKPPAAVSFREEREDSWFRPHPAHPWLDPAACGDPGHVPARRAVAVDGKERKGAKAGGKKKVHLLAAVTHVPGLVIAQDRVAKAGKANEVTHFVPLLAPLPLDDVLVTSDAMQATRDNARWLRKAKKAHYLWPVLGNQPNLNAQLSALPWESAPVAAATSEVSRGRIETRTIRVLPAPDGTGFEDAHQAILIERYTTFKKNGQWRTRAEAVLYLTSLASDETAPEDLLAHVRGHWRVEHAHWPRHRLRRGREHRIHRKRSPGHGHATAISPSACSISPASPRSPAPSRPSHATETAYSTTCRYETQISNDFGDPVLFDSEEQAKISEQIRQIKAYIRKTHQLSNEQFSHIEERLDEADQASRRIGRKDWLMMFNGAVFSLVLSDLIPPSAAYNILIVAVHGLGHLFGITPPLPPTLPGS